MRAHIDTLIRTLMAATLGRRSAVPRRRRPRVARSTYVPVSRDLTDTPSGTRGLVAGALGFAG